MCRECPPAPSCPPPERCPDVKCPPPAVCPPQPTCTPRDEVRYIKVPTVITKTVMVDSNGNVISQQINSGSTATPMTPMATVSQNLTSYVNNPSSQSLMQTPMQSQSQTLAQALGQNMMQMPSTTQGQMPSTTQGQMPSMTQGQTKNLLNSIFSSGTQIPTTTFPTMSINIPNTTLAQTLDNNTSSALCPSADLNSEFKKYGIYGI